MVTWVVFLSIGLIVGMVAGVYFGQLDIFRKKQREELKEKLEKTENELTRYKMEVTEHFLITASLVNSMTESYQAVHEHLAKGAGRLCDSAVNVDRLSVAGQEQLEKISLERKGEKLQSDAAIQEAPAPEVPDPIESASRVNEAAEPGQAPEQTKAPSDGHKPEIQAQTPPQESKDPVAANNRSAKPKCNPKNLAQSEEAPEPTGVKPNETVADLLQAENSAAADENRASSNPKRKPPESGKTPELVEPPSTPESLSLDEDDSSGHTVH